MHVADRCTRILAAAYTGFHAVGPMHILSQDLALVAGLARLREGDGGIDKKVDWHWNLYLPVAQP
jgi:hypothetical protein